MTPRASHIVRAVAALAAGTLIMLPDTGRIAERPDPTSVYAAEDASEQVRDDLEEESYEDDDDAAEPDLAGAATLSPSQIKRVTLTPSASRSVLEQREEGPCFTGRTYYGLPSDTHMVGFARADRTDCQSNAVYQTLLSFEGELGELRSLLAQQKPRLSSATLSWSEKRHVTPDMSGASCVAFLSKPREDWVGVNKSGRMPNSHFSGPERKNRWDVKDLFQEWLNDPAAGRRGVVVRGLDDALDLDGDSVCYSTLTNPRIKMVYTTPLSPSSQSAPQPAPQPARPTKPDLMVTRVTGPTEVSNGATAVYEVVLANDGTVAQGTAQVRINAGGPLEPEEIVQTPDGFTCELGELGFSCTGSLGGVDAPIQQRVAIFKVQVRGVGTGRANVVGTANSERALDEMTVDNNIQQVFVTVK